MPLPGNGHSHSRRQVSSQEGPLPDRRPASGASLFFLLPASMTVEAALVLPLFLLFFVCLFTLFDGIRLESSMVAALHEAGTATAEYAYYLRYAEEDLKGRDCDYTKTQETKADSSSSSSTATDLASQALEFLTSETAVRETVVSFLGEDYVANCCLADGGRSISYLQSDLLTADDHIDLVADYRIEPFGAGIFGVSKISLQARYYGHAFTGYEIQGGGGENAEEDEEIVFITPSGTVYHRNRNCKYLHIDSYPVPALTLTSARNSGGAKYYPCERCHPVAVGSVFVTAYGNRYHASRDCPSLKRTVLEVPLSQVEDSRRPCSNCGGGS